eukprot:gene20299-biopygen18264
MAAARPNCARLRAATASVLHAAVALGMVRMDGAKLMVAPPVQSVDSSNAPNTVVGRRGSRAPWRAAPLEVDAMVSVRNTAVVQVNAGFQAAATVA